MQDRQKEKNVFWGGNVIAFLAWLPTCRIEPAAAALGHHQKGERACQGGGGHDLPRCCGSGDDPRHVWDALGVVDRDANAKDAGGFHKTGTGRCPITHSADGQSCDCLLGARFRDNDGAGQAAEACRLCMQGF